VRVAHLRTGIVLTGKGGALAKQLPIFKAGLGAPLGSGRQWVSWISLRDEVAAIRHCLTADVRGPVNLVGPRPVTNREFTKVLGKAVRGRRCPCRSPASCSRRRSGLRAGGRAHRPAPRARGAAAHRLQPSPTPTWPRPCAPRSDSGLSPARPS
jgi:NAD dependent epimerase/dehydratase family enzyme